MIQKKDVYYILLFLKIVAFIVLNSSDLRGQTATNNNNLMSRIISIDSLFKFYGTIFDSSYTSPIEINNIKQRFTPNETDIIAAERIFREQYNIANQSAESRKGAKFVNDVNKRFRKFNRQYIGYIDNENNRNLIIHLFDYSKRKAVKKYLGDSWKNSLVIVLSDNLPFEIVTYRVDLTAMKLYATF
ncbi:MAG TPA: hypothetical protein PK209_13375 [Saprospiraceae bacterium]|nr:hypothetical protein [Saprospiraceae bacterium]